MCTGSYPKLLSPCQKQRASALGAFKCTAIPGEDTYGTGPMEPAVSPLGRFSSSHELESSVAWWAFAVVLVMLLCVCVPEIEWAWNRCALCDFYGSACVIVYVRMCANEQWLCVQGCVFVCRCWIWCRLTSQRRAWRVPSKSQGGCLLAPAASSSVPSLSF
jgi:hypothetical protein